MRNYQDDWDDDERMRVAEIAYNVMLKNDEKWSDLSPTGVARTYWFMVANAVLREVSIIMDERIEG